MAHDARSESGDVFDTQIKSIEVRPTSSIDGDEPVFLLFDPSEYILAAFEAERSRCISRPPGIKDNCYHLLVDLSTLESPKDLCRFIARCVEESLPQEKNQALPAEAPSMLWQNMLWRAWLELLIRHDRHFVPPQPTSSKPPSGNNSPGFESESAGKLLNAYLSHVLGHCPPLSLALGFDSISPCNEVPENPPPGTLGIDAAQPENRTGELSSVLEAIQGCLPSLQGDESDLDLLSKHLANRFGNCVLCITGISDLEESLIRPIHEQLRRIRRGLGFRAVLLINPPGTRRPLDSTVVRYPAIKRRGRYDWLHATPLFLLPSASHDPCRPLNDTEQVEVVLDESSLNPLLRAAVADLDGVRVAWTAANGSLRSLLRIARRARQIAGRLES